MYMKIKKIVLPILFLIVLIGVCITNFSQIQDYIKINIQKYGEPIDIETGIVNNKYFNINSNGENAQKTTYGINKALKYAQNNNIKNVKLEFGKYQVIGYNNSHYRGLTMQSNINLDLNGSTIIQEPNDKYVYANISMYGIENANITNGIIIGDTDKHIYNQENGKTHEGGYGISIIDCKNVKLTNLEIYNMTGDGINLYGANKGEKIDDDVVIENCNIHDCRRQGITIGCGENIIIQNNEIYDIKGTAPQAGIDIEGNLQTEITDKIIIQNNKIYNLGNNNALLFVGFIKNVEVNDNEIEQNVLVYDAKESITFKNNKFKNAIVNFSNDYTNMRVGHNIKNLKFIENYLENSSLKLSKVWGAEIESNNIINGNIENASSSCKIYKNQLKNEKESIDIAINLSNISGHTEKYTASIKDNIINGNYKEQIKIDENFYTIE